MAEPAITAIGMTMDCADPVALADFWEAAIGFTERSGDGAPYVTLSASPVGRPLNHLTLQRVPEAKTTKVRAHLDLFSRDPEAEADRLVGLGARRLDWDQGDEDHGGFVAIVLADPEGNEFCVVGRVADAS
ncbi:MAG: VOC family protein [Actinomycetota bacterium]